MCLSFVDNKTNLEELHKIKAYKRFATSQLTGNITSAYRDDEKEYVIGETYYDHPLAKHFPKLARMLRMLWPSGRILSDQWDSSNCKFVSYPRGFHAYRDLKDAALPDFFHVVCEVELDNIVAVGTQFDRHSGASYVALQMNIIRSLSFSEIMALRGEEEFDIETL